MTGVAQSDGQRLAVDQLRTVAAFATGAIELVQISVLPDSALIVATVSLDCRGVAHAPGGITLRHRERLRILISPGFPFDVPYVWTPHYRWAGTPHVQWGCQLCLYAAPSQEWNPADGMNGLIDRLLIWLERASLGQLDPDDAPLHPPVAYFDRTNGVVVVRADLGDRSPEVPSNRRQTGPTATRAPSKEAAAAYQFMVGVADRRRADRWDVEEWTSLSEFIDRFADGRLQAQHRFGMLGILLDQEIGFEYPARVAELVGRLERLGVPRAELFSAVGIVAAINNMVAGANAEPLAVDILVGTPSRREAGGRLRQHLVCWRFDDLGRLIAENLIFKDIDDETVAKLAAAANQLLPSWVDSAKTSWVQVMEARSEVTIRRDRGSPANWVQGKRILVLGCGALGAPIAEFCVRAGARALQIVDNDLVTPGILVRQPYLYDDIGRPKAEVLAEHLNRIRADQPVTPVVGQAQDALPGSRDTPDFDLVIDATADAAVASLLEGRRATKRECWPPVISVVVGHTARRGIAAIANVGATGTGRDILRRIALLARQRHVDDLRDIAHDLFPTEQRAEIFQPEPGCSSPTFVGSAAELAALAGTLVDGAFGALHDDAGPMVAVIARLDNDAVGLRPTQRFAWPNDLIAVDPDTGYEMRFAQQALTTIRSESRRGARLRGPKVETGGLLLGQIDDACRCVWVDHASGPPPDSLLSEVYFEHGTEGVAELISHHRQRSGRLTGYVGMWHIHPYGRAAPSPTDQSAMGRIVSPLPDGPRRALIAIIGGPQWEQWLDNGDAPDVYARLATRDAASLAPATPPTPHLRSLERWPGGWSNRRTAPPRRRRRRRRLLPRRQPHE